MKKSLTIALGAMLMLSNYAGSASANEVRIETQVNKVIGTPYLMGGTSTSGFDCSGFILYIMDKYNINLPRTSQMQAKSGAAVEMEDLRTGDLVFFNTSGRGISHAGIYIGNDSFAHSSSSKGVTISGLNEKYYKERYVMARRVTSLYNSNKMTEEIH
ncbi:C40 family peptidase [Paenibacillus sp. UMB7766-LJ446]|uniref:C40 family peptidase n=1 Tax=Paenibacillus sp. UMB7766-LJ446 TaxID=3046313 RepID=UPI00254AAF87|nr:C40 family peptidase [Paenibacillus sp. UMB7766-LJ446]MDK8193090.1 C40 family peptidase [Paenibacillus sp. UMB7766-LJ446]